MDVVVDLPAVRPARLALNLGGDVVAQAVRDLRPVLQAATAEDLDGGIRLALCLDVTEIAILADQIRTLANEWPFLSFRVLADPPVCWLEVTGDGPAGVVARTVFGEIGR